MQEIRNISLLRKFVAFLSEVKTAESFEMYDAEIDTIVMLSPGMNVDDNNHTPNYDREENEEEGGMRKKIE